MTETPIDCSARNQQHDRLVAEVERLRTALQDVIQAEAARQHGVMISVTDIASRALAGGAG